MENKHAHDALAEAKATPEISKMDLIAGIMSLSKARSAPRRKLAKTSPEDGGRPRR